MRVTAKRGMVLFVTLVLSAVIALFLAGAVQLLPTLGVSATNLEHRERALLAAQSGLDYARSRLQSDPTWLADDDNGVVVDTPNLKVVEDHGNVFGIITGEDNVKSMFRFRFNYQNDGDDPDDDLDDPSRFIGSEYVSYNNLMNANQLPQFRAELNGGVWKVTDTSPTAGDLPKFTAAMIVEGFAGPAVGSVTPSSVNIDPTKGSYSRHVVEAYFSRPGFLNVDAGVMAANRINADLLDGGSMRVESDNNGEAPKVRTLDQMDVYSSAGSANYVTPSNGEVVVDLLGDFYLNGASSSAPTADKEDAGAQSPSWLSLGFDQVTRAQSTDPQIKAGTYMWKTGPPRLEYFPVEYDPLNPPTGSGVVMSNGADMMESGGGAVDITPSNFRVRIRNNALVAPQGAVTGLSIVAENGLMATVGRRPELILNSASDTESVILSNDDGGVLVQGKIEGSGSVTSAESITFQGSSAIEVDPTMSVALYAKDDINMSGIPAEVWGQLEAQVTSGGKGKGGKGKAKGHSPGPSPGLADSSYDQPQDVAFGGIIYAQKNFNVNLLHSNQAGPIAGANHGRFFLKGILATYGGDPAIHPNPGALVNDGQVNLVAADAHFIYDPDYLDALHDLDAPVRLDKGFWTTH